MSSNPTISVITATRNSADHISACIRSVNEQTWPWVEHIFVDGASKDATVDLIRRTSSRPSKLISEPDRGIYDALNKGLALASGDVVGFLHSDDTLFDRNVLRKVADAFTDPALDATYGDLHYVDRSRSDKIIRRWRSSPFDRAALRAGWMPPHPTLYVRRSLYDKIGRFDISYRISADYLSIIQLFSMPGFRSAYIPSVLVNMGIGGISNRSLKTIVLKSREDYRALRSAGVGGVNTLLRKNLSKIVQFF